MNKNLTFEIVNHIFSGLGINSSIINLNLFQSIRSKQFLLDKRLSFSDENDQDFDNKVWGVQYSLNDNTVKILIGDCTTDSDVLQYCGIVHLQDNPFYGISACYTSNNKSYVDPQPLICVSTDGKNWMECNTYLQATFLAAMENTKELSFISKKCENYNVEFEALQTFIKYYDNFYEVKNEGEEN